MFVSWAQGERYNQTSSDIPAEKWPHILKKKDVFRRGIRNRKEVFEGKDEENRRIA